jgi:integrase
LEQLDYSREWLFTNSGRGRRSPDDPVRGRNFLRTVWNPAVERAKLDPKPRVHDLRHTCASWLIQDGAPLPSIQAHLGHESIEVTVGIYGHLDRSSGEALADLIDKRLGTAKPDDGKV